MSSPINENQVVAYEKHEKTISTDNVTEQQIHRQARNSGPAVILSAQPNARTQEFEKTRSKPKLPNPDISTFDIIGLLRELQRTNSTSDVTLALAHAQQINYQLDLNRASELESKQKIDKQNTEITEKQKTKKVVDIVLSIVGLIFAAIAAAAAYALVMALTGGLAAVTAPAVFMAGVAVVGAIGGLVMGLTTAVNLVVHELKLERTNVFGEKVPLEISVAGLDEIVEEGKVKNGDILIIGVNSASANPRAISRTQYNKNTADSGFRASMILSGAMILLSLISIGQAVVSFFRGGTQIASTTVQVAEKTTEAAQRLSTAGAIAQTVGSALMAGTSGYSAALSIMLAYAKKTLGETMISEKTIEAAIQMLQQQFDANQQQFRSAMDFQESLRTRIANIMGDYFESQIAIAKNSRV